MSIDSEAAIDEPLAEEIRDHHRRPKGRVDYRSAFASSAKLIARLLAMIADQGERIDALKRAAERRGSPWLN